MTVKSFVEETYVKFQIAHTANKSAAGLGFVLESCGHFNCSEKYFTERSGLKSWILIYTLSGNGIVRFRNIERELHSKSCLILDCEEDHYYATKPNSSWEFYYLHFRGISAKSYSDFVNGNAFEVFTIQQNLLIEDSFKEIFSLARVSSELVDFSINLGITQIFSTLIEAKQSSTNKKYISHLTDVEKTKSYLELNYNREINIVSLSREVNISKFYFIKVFKELTGQTPYEYLTDIRINAAKKLLIETSKSVREVSGEVGFADMNNFIKLFKKRTGTTPLIFKRFWIN
ncbi:MAG: AraC family transcriptional regulator [Bacillota bacterium]